MKRIIENMKWRSAIKRYDAQKKVSQDDIETLKQVISLTPTSYGLQPFKVVIVEDLEIRKKLQEASWGQGAVVDASHFIILANYTKVDQSDIDAYFDNLMTTRNRTVEQEKAYKEEISYIIQAKGDKQEDWSARQTYLTLGVMIAAAADLRIDLTPMEGFDAAKYNEILGLNEQNLNASVVAAVGYRAEDDYWSPLEKIRKPQEQLFDVV